VPVEVENPLKCLVGALDNTFLAPYRIELWPCDVDHLLIMVVDTEGKRLCRHPVPCEVAIAVRVAIYVKTHSDLGHYDNEGCLENVDPGDPTEEQLRWVVVHLLEARIEFVQQLVYTVQTG